MALVAITGTLGDWIMATRPGKDKILGTNTPYTALVSDLQVGDYLSGARATVTAVGAVGTTRTVTVERTNGLTATFTWVSTSSLQIVR